MQLIKQIVRVGNSAGIVLPKEWLNGKAKVVLIEKALEPEKEIFKILKNYLYDIAALAVVGSYARGEANAESDVDVLAITASANKKIKIGRYEIIMISEKALKEQLKSNALPLLPMILEARPLMNQKLFDLYKNTNLTKKNLLFHFKTTQSAMKVVEEILALANERKREFMSDGVSYSLVLRLREMYIIDCILNKRIWKNRFFLKIIKEITGSLTAYEGYLRVKNDKGKKSLLPLEEAKKLHSYISHKIKEQEKIWAETKR